MGMVKPIRLIWALCAALLAIALVMPCAAEEARFAAPSTAGKLRVEGTQLVGSDGKPVQLRGVSTHGLAWYPDYVNVACFAQLRYEWNANVVRLAMYTAEYGGYCEGGDREALKRLIRDGVRYATLQDMYVIIDWHILSDNDPNMHLDEARAFFAEMSAEYADADNVLYEICNEPNGATSWSDVKAYAEQVIQVIRQNDRDAIVIVGTPNWSQDVHKAAADPITGFDNVMYALHFYATSHREELRGRMADAIEVGLPIFVSEYGICDASGNGAIDVEEANRWVETMDRYGVSYVAWNLSNKDESSAMLRPSCAKTAGFATEDLSECGLWVRDMLSGEHTAASADSAQSGNAASGAQAPDAVFDCGDFRAEVTQAGQWEEGGKPVYQYNLTVVNASESDCTSWTVELPFDGAFEMVNGWNGMYAADGNVLRVSSVSYNGSIAAGASATDIGFIVKGASITRAE